MDRKGRNLIMAISYPPIFINDYLKEKLSAFSQIDIPFFPTSPSTIDQLTQSFANLNNQAGLFAVYDRMFRMRRRAFPHIKDEQLLYYFYGTAEEALPTLIYTTQAVADILDRGDESAQDINEWIATKLDSNGLYVPNADGQKFLPVYFHDIKIYQLQESRDIVDFGTARTFAGNKIIIDYCYHSVGYPKGNPVEGFDPARPRYEDASNATYNGTAL
jgi:hypothetical protein